MSTHATNGGLCEEEHLCPPCEDETGEKCRDLFEHPTCGIVACNATDPACTRCGSKDPDHLSEVEYNGKCDA